jgi:3-dehydroquinate synthase
MNMLQIKLAEVFSSGQKPVVIADEKVWQLFPELAEIFSSVPTLLLKSAEAIKSLDGYAGVLTFLAELNVSRTGCVIAIGGGTIGDLAGFAAATYRRGIAYVQVPTTLLAMVDSAYGGKVGINLLQGKNLIGAFQLPQEVWIEKAFLNKLPPSDWNSGMAEFIKSALIGDAVLFDELEKSELLTPRSSNFADFLDRAVSVKKHLAEIDFRETSVDPVKTRRLLNLGHTFGHAIEKVSGFAQYPHGQAVALGIRLAARLSQQIGWLNSIDLQRIETLLSRYELPKKLTTPLPVDLLIAAMFHDKKVQNGHLNLVLLEKIGAAKVMRCDDLGMLEKLWLDIGALAH